MSYKLALRVAVACCFAAALHAGEPSSSQTHPAKPAHPSAEAQKGLDAALYTRLARWDDDAIEQLAREVRTLPEADAAEILWLASTVPPPLNPTPVFTAALSSSSPLIRNQAADAMLAMDNPKTINPLIEFLNAPEADASFLNYVAAAIAAKPSQTALRLLMRAMLSPNLKQEAVDALGEQLRAITRVNLPNDPAAWRKWGREQTGREF